VSTTVEPLFSFDNTFVRELGGLYESWPAEMVPEPRLLALNDELAAELGLDADRLRSADGVACLVGNAVPVGAEPVAQAYSGHQFGGYSPRLGDGRALLLGEVIDVHGRRRDIHLKGSGRTPFARGGDGKAAVGPMLRELIISEAMHALGVPTTRSLAVISTGERIVRDSWQPGAVLVRVAASHLRVGTFQYAASTQDLDLLRRLADYAIDRHYPSARESSNPYLAFYESVLDAQASLIARWMNIGFIHGVMNTDNVTISGETIDYGPCAFMDRFDPATVFSSIDHGGRYAYGNQPMIGQWNMARFAEAIAPLVDSDPEKSVPQLVEVLKTFPDRYDSYWKAGLRTKLGLTSERADDDELFVDLLKVMEESSVDFTAFFRHLADAARGDRAGVAAISAWVDRWLERVTADSDDLGAVASAMDAVNPVYVPRNHLVEEALAAGSEGDLSVLRTLLEVLSDPYTPRPEFTVNGVDRFAEPAPADGAPYVTYCGT
jgi:uncharacterized protein YdiU (UPF0061 family)